MKNSGNKKNKTKHNGKKSPMKGAADKGTDKKYESSEDVGPAQYSSNKDKSLYQKNAQTSNRANS